MKLMTLIAALVAALVLAGCVSTKACKGDVCAQWKSLGKDVEDVSIDVETPDSEYHFNLGSSTSSLTPEQMAAARCLVFGDCG
jgi:PBP1b-binding outer membrane lipoprotein LpoB